MRQSEHAEILDGATNLAVVRLPGRKYPGSVIQGDSLIYLTRLVREARAEACGPEEILSELDEVISERLAHYLNILQKEKIDPPADVSWFHLP